MFEYTFTKSNIIYLEFINPLLQDLNLTPYNLEYIDDVLKVVYTEELTSEQYNTLNAFITSYDPPLTKPNIFHSCLNIQMINNKVLNTEWSLIGSCEYNTNTNVSVNLINVTHISNIDIGNYQLRVFNMNNNTIIGTSSNLSNSIREINTIEIINKPTTDNIIELHGKVSDIRSSCNINSAQLNLYVKGD